MKCDELKPYLVGYERQYYVYDATSVEEAIAELKQFAEDACLERDDNQTAIDELQAENRKLRRALYKACANWAFCKYIVKDKYNEYSKGVKWLRMLRKCRAKAEQYK